MLTQNSQTLFTEALDHIPGGVNSPVRAYGAVGGVPLYIKKSKGAYIWDVDGNKYCDYVGSWGPAILGHARQEVVEAVAKVAADGLSFGAPTESETILAKMIISAFPSMEKVRFVSSGTEACMSAIRLARGYTKRDKFIKFDGNYHGHADSLLVKAGSGALNTGVPNSSGVTPGTAADTLVAEYNNLQSVEMLFKAYPDDIAAIIVEPIVGNSGFIRPVDGFLQGLRDLCTENGALLIFDEVMTGFRVSYGGVQTLLKIDPDLTTLGKVVGGGLPLAVYGGKSKFMDLIAPLGAVYQAGTLSGNPLATISGIKTLELLSKNDVYPTLAKMTHTLVSGMEKLGDEASIPLKTDSEGGMFGFFFADKTVKNLNDAKETRLDLFPKFFKLMLDRGQYFAPSPFEAGFVSLAHTSKDIDFTIESARIALKKIRYEH